MIGFSSFPNHDETFIIGVLTSVFASCEVDFGSRGHGGQGILAFCQGSGTGYLTPQKMNTEPKKSPLCNWKSSEPNFHFFPVFSTSFKMFWLYLETIFLFWPIFVSSIALKEPPNSLLHQFPQQFLTHESQLKLKEFALIFNQLFNFLGVCINMNIKKKRNESWIGASPLIFSPLFSLLVENSSLGERRRPLVPCRTPTWGLGTFDLCDTSGWIGDWYGWYGWIAIWKKTASWVKLWMIQI